MPTNPVSKIIFPPKAEGLPSTRFCIHILSEGYGDAGNDQRTAKQNFNNDCNRLLENLLKVAPFNFLKQYPNFTIYSHFIPGTASLGPRITPTPGDIGTAFPAVPPTPLDSTFNTSNQKLYLKIPAIENYVDNLLAVKRGLDSVTLFSTINPVFDPDHVGSGVIFVLMPSYSGTYDNIIEMEDKSKYYIVASTANVNFEFVLARAIARSIGLGEEFSLSTQTSPSTAEEKGAIAKYPNLVLIDPAPSTAYSYDPQTILNGIIL